MFSRCAGWLLGLALGCCAASARAGEEIRPGMALPPAALSPEAARYEALLQGQEVEQADDSVEKRRHFDERLLHLGVDAGFVEFMPRLALALEVDVLDRLAVGAEAGVNVWGWEGGAYLRVRPFVWGGRGRGALHAFTLQGGYRYTAYGEDYLLGMGAIACLHTDECFHPNYLPTVAHMLIVEAGFEHALWSGWTMRYGVGAAILLGHPNWRCEELHMPVECGTQQQPSAATFVEGFVLSHSIF